MAVTEFAIEGQHQSDRRSPIRWIRWHLTRYKLLLIASVGSSVTQNLLGSAIPILVGAAFTAVLETPPDGHRLTLIAAAVLGVVLLRGLFDLGAALTTETLAQRLSRDARDEIYVSLLGKSQTYHNRQQVGDLMARTANDVRQLGMMVNPGLSLDLRFDDCPGRADRHHRAPRSEVVAPAPHLHRVLRHFVALLHETADSSVDGHAHEFRQA